MNYDFLYHLLPGYSLYHAAEVASSDEPFAIKAQTAALGGTLTGLHILNATHHALKIQRVTLSSPRNLTMFWRNVSVVAPYVPVITAAVVTSIAAVVVGEQLGKRSKPGGVDMYSDEIATYEQSAYGFGPI